MTINEQLALLRRGTAEIISEEDLAKKLQSGRPLRVKLGVDPTVAHVTLGWAVVLRKLRDFQRLGHIAVLIIGDFTAMIGDPSGKSKTRPQLSREEVERNVAEVSKQVNKILDPDRTEIRYNRDWLGKLSLEDFVHIAAKTTVARIMERDDFTKRWNDHRAIGLHEILYPLCQGYDSVEVQADAELGGTDQKFNNLVGRDLQGHYGQEPQTVMLCPLLVGTDGTEKMSQSLGNFVSVVDEPNDMYGKTMSIPDHLLTNWFELCTDVPMEEVRELVTAEPYKAKRRLAYEITALYHSASAGQAAADYFDNVFAKREMPDEVPEESLPPELLATGSLPLAQLVATLGLARSNGAARQLIQQGAVSLEGEKLTDPFARLEVADLDGKLLRVGRHQFRRLVLPR